MADFVQNPQTKSAIRELTTPIAKKVYGRGSTKPYQPKVINDD